MQHAAFVSVLMNVFFFFQKNLERLNIVSKLGWQFGLSGIINLIESFHPRRNFFKLGKIPKQNKTPRDHEI
jgi:hypothetical protein